MSRIKKTTRTVLAVLLSLTVAATFYPMTAFAGTDYEAAYNQAHEQAQTAYTDWQNAVSDADAKKSIYDQAVEDYNAAVNAVEPVYQEMLKKQRILDFKTREAIEYYAKQAWSADWGNTSNMGRCTDTEDRINYLLSQSSSGNLNTLKNYFITNAHNDMGWFTPGKSLRMNVTNIKCIPQGITTSASGNDDTTSIDLFTRYVYFNQRYDMLMLDLDYFDEMNQLRNMEGKSPLMVSPYLMLQSTVNAPLNKYGHNVLARTNQYDSTCGQNLASCWGEVGALNGYDSTIKDPYMGLFWAEKPTQDGHYQLIIGTAGHSTHAGMACSPTVCGSGVPTGGFGEIFEQDFAKMSGKTGPSVATYRNNINSYVSQQLNNYNSAKTAYNNANKNVETKNTAKKNALNDYATASGLASTKKTAYDNAAAAEQTAYEAYQNWLENGNDDPVDPGNGGSQPSVPTSIGNITQLSVSNYGKDGSQYVIYVSWNPASGANKYEIQESVNGGSWTNKSPVTTSYAYIYTDKASTKFKYRVRGVYEGNGTTVYGDFNTSSECTTPAAETPTVTSVGDVTPITVSNGGKDGNEYIISVSWKKASNATEYEVYEKVGSGSWLLKTTTLSTSVQFYTTAASTTFKYQIRGVYRNGSTVINGAVGSSSAYTTPAAQTPTTTLGKVTNVRITQTGWNGLTNSYNVKITWAIVDGASKYKVFISINNGNYESEIYTTTSCTCSVPYNGTVKCKVAAMDANGNVGPESDVASLTVGDGSEYGPTNPTQPTDQVQPANPITVKLYLKSFKVVKGKKCFTAKWKKQSKANQKKFSGYQIRYSLKKSMKGAKYVTAKKSAKYKKIKRLKAGKMYYVQVRTFTVTGGVKHYSKWSVKKAVKTR